MSHVHGCPIPSCVQSHGLIHRKVGPFEFCSCRWIIFCIEWYFNDLTCLSLINTTLNFNYWFVLKKIMNFNSILVQVSWKQSIYCSTCQWKGVPSQFLTRVHNYICWSFCRPDVWFNVKVLKSLQIMEVPLLKSWIQANIDDGITKGLYLHECKFKESLWYTGTSVKYTFYLSFKILLCSIGGPRKNWYSNCKICWTFETEGSIKVQTK